MKTAKAADKETFTGRLVDLLCPMPEDIDLCDIATSLAFINRFDGHAGIHYSVAQHSVLVADLLDRDDRVHGLLHDAPEYLIGDLTSPVKEALKTCCKDFGRAWGYLERAAERAIYDSLGLALPSDEVRERVKRADLMVLATEQRDIMQSPNRWNVPFGPSDGRIVPVPAGDARQDFLIALAACGVEQAGIAREALRWAA